jgi:bacterioferritin
MSSDMATTGILAEDNRAKRGEILEMLAKAYWMEVETVMSYLAGAINPDGVRAQEIIASLEQDIDEELGHAKQFANRIKELYGVVPGSLEFSAEQTYLQPPQHQTDIVHVIKGVIEAETGAIEHYNAIIEATDDSDLGHAGHGDHDPPGRGATPPPVRGLPARVPLRRIDVSPTDLAPDLGGHVSPSPKNLRAEGPGEKAEST